MAYRIGFRFVQQSSKLGSWTENFWLDTDDQTVAITEANNLRLQLNNAKGAQVYCPSYRVSKVGTFRASEQILFPTAAPVASNIALYDADYPTTKLLLEFRSSTNKTVQWFGGLVDGWISASGNYVANGTSAQWMNQFFARLTGPQAPWSIRVLDPNRPTFLVKAIDPATGIVTTNTNTFPADARVRIKGVRGLTQANAVWRITVITSTSFSLNGWIPTTTLMTKGDPTVRQQTYTFQKIVRTRIVRSTSHKVGKMPDQLSGKATSR